MKRVKGKICSECKLYKFRKEFYKSITAKNGMQTYCKECSKKRNRTRIIVEYECDTCKRIFKRVKLCPKVERSRTKRCNKCARYIIVQSNDGHSYNYIGSKHFAGRMIGAWKSSAKRRNHKWNLTKEYLDFIYNQQNGICALSGVLMDANIKGRAPSIDRIDPKIGYIEGNIQFVCAIVNIIRNKLEEEEFLFWCKSIINYRKVL